MNNARLWYIMAMAAAITSIILSIGGFVVSAVCFVGIYALSMMSILSYKNTRK